jgi:hypothetical protein
MIVACRFRLIEYLLNEVILFVTGQALNHMADGASKHLGAQGGQDREPSIGIPAIIGIEE